MQELLTPTSKVMGEREDYFDLWSQVIVTEVRKTRKNGVYVVEHLPVTINVGCEFMDVGFGFEHTRQNLGMFADGFCGFNVADWMPETGWRLFFSNKLWNCKVVV